MHSMKENMFYHTQIYQTVLLRDTEGIFLTQTRDGEPWNYFELILELFSLTLPSPLPIFDLQRKG